MAFADLLAQGDSLVRSVLGQEIVYAPGSGEPVEVDGVYDAAFQFVDSSGLPGVNSQAPAVFLTLSDLPTDPETDTGAEISVGEEDFAIREVRKDGQGGVMLLLHRV